MIIKTQVGADLLLIREKPDTIDHPGIYIDQETADGESIPRVMVEEGRVVVYANSNSEEPSHVIYFQ